MPKTYYNFYIDSLEALSTKQDIDLIEKYPQLKKFVIRKCSKGRYRITLYDTLNQIKNLREELGKLLIFDLNYIVIIDNIGGQLNA